MAIPKSALLGDQYGLNSMLESSSGTDYILPDTKNTLYSSGLAGYMERGYDALSDAWGEAGTLDANGNYTGGSGISGVINNASLMKNLTGLGSLGLGLANYFQNKGLLDLQKKGLEQNIAFADEDQTRQRTNRQSAANYEYRDRTGVA